MGSEMCIRDRDIASLTFANSSPRVSNLEASTCARRLSTSASYFLRRSLAVSHELNGAVIIAATNEMISKGPILILQAFYSLFNNSQPASTSGMTAGMPFSTSLMAAARAHIVPLSSTSGTYVVGTCISRHTRVM